MDFYAELTKRKEAYLSAIGEMSYKRHQLSVDLEEMQKQSLLLSNDIRIRERMVGEIEQSLRDFDTYLAVKEGAMTMGDLKSAIEQSD